MLSNELVDYLSGEVQGKIGEFLQLKKVLVKLKNSPISGIPEKATILLSQQVELENKLTILMPKLDSIKAGNYEVMDMFDIGLFYTQMIAHTGNVNELNKQNVTAGGENAFFASSIPAWAWLAVAGVAAAIAFKKFR